MQKLTTFLMFDGLAEEAMNFYITLFPGSQVKRVSRYADDAPRAAGKVQHALFALGGQEFMCIDSAAKHDFPFKPARSLHVACDSPDELDLLYAKLSNGGQTVMPPDSYPFSERYAWVSDRFGVSWQLGFGQVA